MFSRENRIIPIGIIPIYSIIGTQDTYRNKNRNGIIQLFLRFLFFWGENEIIWNPFQLHFILFALLESSKIFEFKMIDTYLGVEKRKSEGAECKKYKQYEPHDRCPGSLF